MARAHDLSPQEAMLIRRADEALDELSSHYPIQLFDQFQSLSDLVSEGKWDEAGELAHMIGGEAGSFQYVAIGEVAGLMRDIFFMDSRDEHSPTIKILLDAFSLMIKGGVKRDQVATEELLSGLRAVVSRVN